MKTFKCFGHICGGINRSVYIDSVKEKVTRLRYLTKRVSNPVTIRQIKGGEPMLARLIAPGVEQVAASGCYSLGNQPSAGDCMHGVSPARGLCFYGLYK